MLTRAPTGPTRADAAAPAARAAPTVQVVRSGRGGASLDSVRELVRFKEVFWAFVVRKVKVKYKEAAVGVGWAVLQPVLAALVLALFLGRFARVPSDGVPYLVFAVAGMIAWTYFSGAAGVAMESLVVDRGLLRKVYFPREIVPLSAVVAGLVDLGPGLAAVAAIGALHGIGPALAWVALPLPVLVLVLVAGAAGLVFSAVNVYYRDARHALPFLLMLGMYTAPVLYPLSVIPSEWRGVYVVGNPLVAAVDGVREIMVHGSWPDLGVMAGATAWAGALFVAAYAFFKRVERGFADRV